MSIYRNHLPIMGASGQSTGYTIDQSIRFNFSDSAYMHKTYSGAGDRTSWTWSCWFKLGSLNAFTPASNLYYQFFSVDEATNDANRGSFHIINDSGVASATQFQFIGHSTVFLKTNRQFRDPSAWMHLVLVWDSDNGLASDRARLYINGERETSFATENNPSSGQEIGINLAAKHYIGAAKNISSSAIEYYFDGYMADIHFLDGYSYGPEYFGEFKENTDIWTPIKYSGSYGTNGFYLKGQNSSALGDDSSGNNNDFTTSGMAAHDQITDSPTHNFATYNSIGANDTYSSSTVGITNGNLEFDSNGGSSLKVVGLTIDNNMLEGYKWYFEIAITGSSFNTTIGFRNADNGDDTPSIEVESDGQIKKDSGNEGSATGGFSAGDIFGIRLDWTNSSSRKISFYKNNTIITGEQTFSASTSGFIFYARESGSGFHHLNTGQNGTFNGNKTAQGNSDANGIGNFYYAVPSGHFAISHKSLNLVS